MKVHSSERTQEIFKKYFKTEPLGVWAAPGRVNLIGEHTDYNEGFVLPFALDKTTHCGLSLRKDNTITVTTVSTKNSLETVTTTNDLQKNHIEGWSAYPLGVLWAIQNAGYPLPGMNIFITSNVPIGSGLSSSAALECSVALAINDSLKLGMERKKLANLCRQAENEVVGAPTGIMDQTVSLLGEKDHALYLDCRSLDTALVALHLQSSQASILVIDTHVSHVLADGQGYAARKKSCDKAATLMSVPSLRDVAIKDLHSAPETMDSTTFKRMRHIVTENERVLSTAKTLSAGTINDIGALLNESHISMRDDFDISCPELNLAVETSQNHGAMGARMTGGGFGGSAIAIVKNDDIDTIKKSIFNAFANTGYTMPSIFSVSAGTGAQKIG